MVKCDKIILIIELQMLVYRMNVVRNINEFWLFLSSGRSEGQLNGETNAPIEGNQAGDAAASARSLPNEEIVQKIEEVLSGVLDTELRYKPGKLEIINCLKNLKIFKFFDCMVFKMFSRSSTSVNFSLIGLSKALFDFEIRGMMHLLLWW